MANKINYTGTSKILIRICQAINDLIDSGGGGGYTLPTASTTTKGGIKVGSGLSMNGEVLNNTNPTPYSLPTASDTTLGGVKVGSGLSINENGVLSATGGGGGGTSPLFYDSDGSICIDYDLLEVR